ncbi:hypothetical protein P3W85_36855 [Cupriavidus basilensis]|uniref:Uncharacterized protein n=1 Tax=Cupriavidus basilensis TaxID=68895 RepID=A0ABT6B161_9BURK|nr:hypothetical protein [Cupriavidus basilensis]MDF3838464.1 hypothetical protein [Cupriavidus basilensis]
MPTPRIITRLNNPSVEKGYSKTISTKGVAIILAIMPAIATYAVSFVDKIRESELTYVNQQIKQLYGPLYSLNVASSAAWAQFKRMHWPSGGRRYFFDPSHPPTVEQTDQWRNWMAMVFQPINIKIETVIVENSQLVLGNEIPVVFKEAMTQTEAYRAVMAKWKDTDRLNVSAYTNAVGNTVTGLNYPEGIGECVRNGYLALKKRQEELQNNVFSVFFSEKIKPDTSCLSSSQK